MTELEQYISNLRTALDTLEREIPNIYLSAGATFVALIEERITTTGTDDEGKAFRSYTPGYLEFKKNPQNYKRGKELGLASSRFTGKVDYTLTGELWNDIGLIEESVSGTEVKYSWGAIAEHNKEKLRSLDKRDGDPLQPSAEEIDEVVLFADEEIAQIFADVI